MKRTIIQLLSMSRRAKQASLLLLDLLILPILLWMCYAIRLFDWNVEIIPGMILSWILISGLSVLSLLLMGVYHFIVRAFSELFITKLAFAVSLMVITLYLLTYINLASIPMSIPLMYGFFMFGWVWFSRALIRFIVQTMLRSKAKKKRIAIYGAGLAGQQITAALLHSDEHIPLFFIDSKKTLQGQIIGGLKVYSVEDAFNRAFRKYAIDEILIALPSISRSRKNEIIKLLEPAHLKITKLPDMAQLMDGEIKISDIREVDIIDLLGRDPVPPVSQLLAKNIRDKVVMVTGAGGSIGSELCRQIVKNQPKQLIIYELTEFALYSIDKELRLNSDCDIIPILGSVLEQGKLERVIEQYAVQTVYHAAAYKHVPLVECNPIAGLKNNALGTAFSVNAAVKKGVETFVLISTDKAVRPTNVMGASKRMAELYCQAMAKVQHQTQISIVRFGNVLGSSGSVVPLFKQQISKGGPITVTHPEVTRYFMTIPEASQLVIQAGALGTGGDVFLLDMGDAVRIQDLARQMVMLSGLQIREAGSPYGDIEIHYTGLRPGEKLYEELLIDHDDTEVTEHSRILRSFEKDFPLDELQPIFKSLEKIKATEQDINWALTQLECYVDGYQRSGQIQVN